MSNELIEKMALKPCPNPWCASHDRSDAEIFDLHKPIPMDHADHHGKWVVACPVCPISGPACDSRDEAIAAWNNRAALTALIEHAGGDGVTEGDRDAAKSLLGRDDAGPSWWSIDSGNADNDRLVQAFARHRQAAFADGFTAALQGAEAAIWRIEDDAFLYENVSKALQEVISELQAMEQNWTGRVTIEHRQAAIKERDAQIVAWLLNVYDTGSVDGLICRSDGAEDLLRMLGEVR